MLCSVPPPPPPLVCRRATATHATRRGRSGGFSFTALGGPPAPLPTAGPAGGRRTVQHNNIPCRATPHHPSPRRCAQTGGRSPVCVFVRVCVTPPPPVGGGANNPSRACSFRRPRVFCLRGLPARASVVWWVLARTRPRCGRRPGRSYAPRHRGCCSLSDDAAAQGARPAGAGRWALQRAAHASPPNLAGGGWARPNPAVAAAVTHHNPVPRLPLGPTHRHPSRPLPRSSGARPSGPLSRRSVWRARPRRASAALLGGSEGCGGCAGKGARSAVMVAGVRVRRPSPADCDQGAG